MKKIKEGDIVARKSYDKDILFSVKKIIKNQKEDIAILTGVIERIEADSPINDLEEIDKRIISKNIKDAYIYSEIMGSDHCPVGLEIEE